MNRIQKAAEKIRKANFLLICAGAGMGVDSGLPDFRGNEGFWKAYPPMRKLQLSLPEVSTPSWFYKDPTFAWGFFGHRYHLYTKTNPHRGFSILQKIADRMKFGYFVFTSNVDGHFQKAGFENVHECHGSLNFLQCLNDYKCKGDIWSADGLKIEIDESFRAEEPLPKCRHCQELARPNVLMFGDWGWVSDRSDEQYESLLKYLKPNPDKVAVVIEIGAGRAVPTVRRFSESILSSERKSSLIRINLEEWEDESERLIHLKQNALGALEDLFLNLNEEN